MHRRWVAAIFLIVCCGILTILWLPGLKYPVVSDTVHYGLLGRSLWERGTYALEGVPYANHLPLHAFLSYPFTRLLGFHSGMHVSSLIAGFGVLIAAFFLSKRVSGSTSLTMPMMVTAAILIHPAFVLMSMLGSADLLFAALFLTSLLFFLTAEDDRRWYIAAGIVAGLASLTRYNGLPLFALFFGWVCWKRRADLRSKWFWLGLGLGLGLATLWFVRNAITFGNPFYSNYTAELAQEAPNPIIMFLRNIVYYGNPIHNVFPFFFVFALYGLYRHARQQLFLVLAMLAGAMLSMIWWVQAIRFLFPAFVILLFFAVWGVGDVLSKAVSGKRKAGIAFVIVCGVLVQSTSLCLYTYGECNAAFDRSVGILPKNMGLTPEGFYAWHLARNAINRIAEPGASVFYEFPEESLGIFRSDLRITSDSSVCSAYRITQRPAAGGEEILFQTDAWPVTSVVRGECG